MAKSAKQIEIPFDVIEAMLAASNKAIYFGWTTHQVICAGLKAANEMGWVLQADPEARNANVDAAVANAAENKTPHVLIERDKLMIDFFQSRKKSDG